MIPFEAYRTQFSGLCTSEAALELWILNVMIYEDDSPKTRRIIDEATELVASGS